MRGKAERVQHHSLFLGGLHPSTATEEVQQCFDHVSCHCWFWLLSGCNTAVDDAQSVSAGSAFSCLLTTGGGVECWGNVPGPGVTNVATPVVGLESGVTDVVVASVSACVIASDQVLCWGTNTQGQLGNGTLIDSPTPVAVVGLPAADPPVQVTGGSNTLCVRLASGSLWCWGNGFHGQLGDGSTTDSTVPVEVVGFGPPTRQAVDVTSNSEVTCAVRIDGRAFCWGLGARLGAGTATNSPTPLAVSRPAGYAGFRSVEAGSSHVCAIDDDSAVWCWGRNEFGQLAETPSVASELIPIVVEEWGSSSTSLGPGARRTCAVLDDFTAQCVGNNEHGTLGDGTITDTSTPVEVAGTDTDGVVQVDAGTFRTCAVGVDHDVRCWGKNTVGQLGNGSFVDSLAPVTVIR